MIESLKIGVIGTVPLLMHDNKAANPLNPYSKALKHLTSKRKKTDEDLLEIMRLEWEAGLYIHDGGVSIPARCLKACFLNGAKKSKNGKLFSSGVIIKNEWHPLTYKGPQIKANGAKEIPNPDLDKFFEKYHNIDMVRVSGSQVPRCRPIFYEWSLECEINFDTTVLDKRTIVQIVNDAGRLCGLCEKRPELGRFEVVEM